MGGGLFGDKRLDDALKTPEDSTGVTSAWPIYIFPTSNTGSRKYYLWKKKLLVEK